MLGGSVDPTHKGHLAIPKDAIRTSDLTLSGIPALSGTACGKLLNVVGARLIWASEHIP